MKSEGYIGGVILSWERSGAMWCATSRRDGLAWLSGIIISLEVRSHEDILLGCLSFVADVRTFRLHPV